MNPILLEEMAWSFAQLVARKGICIDTYADGEFSRFVPSARDRRACIAFALTREWVSLEEYGHRVYGQDFYKHGPKFFHEKRRRHEALHGIGSYPREDWEG